MVASQLDKAAPHEAVERIHDPRTSEVHRPEPRCRVALLDDVPWMRRPTIVECALRVGNDRGNGRPRPFGVPGFVRERLVGIRLKQHRPTVLTPVGDIPSSGPRQAPTPE
jgi:hypothetical protein